MRLLDSQVIEHGLDVVRGKGLRIGSGAPRHVRWRITAGVKYNAPILPSEAPQLRLPASEIAGEFVYEDHRPSRSAFFIEEADTIRCNRVRHIGKRELRLFWPGFGPKEAWDGRNLQWWRSDPRCPCRFADSSTAFWRVPFALY